MIGPIYLSAMHASRTRRTEPAGQREKTTCPGRSRHRRANDRLESGLVAVHAMQANKWTRGGYFVTRNASSSRDIRHSTTVWGRLGREQCKVCKKT